MAAFTNIQASQQSTLIATKPAVQAVFNTTELLEAILTNLSYSDLSRSQLVCKKFNNTITGSIQLARTRFLAPDTSTRPVYIWCTEDFPYLTGHFTPPSAENRLWNESAGFPDTQVPLPVVTCHPALSMRDWFGSVRGGVDVEVLFPWTLKQLLALPQGGEWERMLVMQPPAKEMHVRVMDHERGKLKYLKISHEDGITFGLIVQRLRMLAYQLVRSCKAKQAREMFVLEGFTDVAGVVTGVTRANGLWVTQAERSENMDRWLHEQAGGDDDGGVGRRWQDQTNAEKDGDGAISTPDAIEHGDESEDEDAVSVDLNVVDHTSEGGLSGGELARFRAFRRARLRSLSRVINKTDS